jgi:hypothetical protein
MEKANMGEHGQTLQLMTGEHNRANMDRANMDRHTKANIGAKANMDRHTHGEHGQTLQLTDTAANMTGELGHLPAGRLELDSRADRPAG